MTRGTASKLKVRWFIDLILESKVTPLDFYFSFRSDGKWYEHGSKTQMMSIPKCP